MTFSRSVSSAGHRTQSGEVELMVSHTGPEEGPTVLFLHGYPDTSHVWLPTIARLQDDVHCVWYDTRGAGESTAPASVDGYRMSYLVDDLTTVMDTCTPDRPVHLVGHDWGSVQAWEAVLRAGSDRRFRGRIASYTSISGPSMAHISAWAHHMRRNGWRGRQQLLRQARRSWYIGFFQLPVVPELAVRATIAGPRPVQRLIGIKHRQDSLPHDARNGLNIYRANRHRAPEDRSPLHTEIPVQLIVPLRDRFLIPEVYDDLPLWCPNLTRHDIDAGHWVQRTHPDQIATWIADHVRAHP